MSKRHYDELWNKGFDDATRHSLDAKDSMKYLIGGLHAVAKMDSNYSHALQTLPQGNKLHACDASSSLNNAWDVIMAGMSSIGSEHTKLMEDLNATAESLEKYRKKESEDRKKVTTDGQANYKELSAYESTTNKAKANYVKQAKALEAAIQRRDEAISDPTKKDRKLIYLYACSTK